MIRLCNYISEHISLLSLSNTLLYNRKRQVPFSGRFVFKKASHDLHVKKDIKREHETDEK